VFGEVKGSRIVYAYPDDLKNAGKPRVKEGGAKLALTQAGK
jgi:branched-chain amino acid transport system substrate-binding protein